MVNLDTLSGLSPYSHITGAQWNGQSNVYWVPSSDTNTYAIGDPVSTMADCDKDGVQRIIPGTPSTASRGVIVGIGFDPTSSGASSRITIPSDKHRDYYVNVVDDPRVIFRIQEGGSDIFLTSADYGAVANFAASPNNGYVSGFYLDNTSIANPPPSGTPNLRLMRLLPEVGNTFGEDAQWLVMFANHELDPPSNVSAVIPPVPPPSSGVWVIPTAYTFEAVQDAVDYAMTHQKAVLLEPGAIYVGGPSDQIIIDLTTFPSGSGRTFSVNCPGSCVFDCSALTAPPDNVNGIGAAVIVIGYSGQTSQFVIEGITFAGNVSHSSGIDFRNVNGAQYLRCTFATLVTGVRYQNDGPANYSEYNIGRHCRFGSNCQTSHIQYQRINTGGGFGHTSFHGSGVYDSIFNIYPATRMEASIIVGTSCHPYSSPLGNCVFFAYNVNPTGDDFYMCSVHYSGGTPYIPIFVGPVRFEISGSDTLHMGRQSTIALPLVSPSWVTPPITVNNPALLRRGNMRIAPFIGALPNSSVAYMEESDNWYRELDTGANTFSGMRPASGALVHVVLTNFNNPSTYLWRAQLFLEADQGGSTAGYVITVAETVFVDTPGYGPPRISTTGTTAGELIITNSNYPAMGSGQAIFAYIDFKQTAQNVYETSEGRFNLNRQVT